MLSLLSPLKTILKRPYTTCLTRNLQRILENGKEGEELEVSGWVKTARIQKTIGFVALSDGSNTKPLQLVFEDLDKNELIKDVTTGCSLKAYGKLVKSPGKNQSLELKVNSLQILGKSDAESYPLQKKKHGLEFLREHGHLRPRTNGMSALLRLRSHLLTAINQSLNQKEFIQVHTPIITSHDCEGGGEVFKIKSNNEEFFGNPAYLTVSAQLHLEMLANSLSRVYTIGPTFRAEGSMTSRHLAEFWMFELELAFLKDLNQLMDLAEVVIKDCLKYLVQVGKEELEFFDKYGTEKGQLLNKLNMVINQPFYRLSYQQAIKELENSKQKFEFQPIVGKSLQSEHEKYLANYYQSPVFITNYPKQIKPFYMKLNQDNSTVACFDLLIPGIGELIGGSLREDDINILENNMNSTMLNEYQWYLDLRRYGSVPHGGFGLGIERFLQFITGQEHIRDTSPYPRYINHCRY
ncbi:asparaginyl-tRNA synthetase [Neoconidiobolus thromboides FSU 785]|nr:asparaginyl-tRNA synthetase [Neoconidiobolus thromboides FSU 785]